MSNAHTDANGFEYDGDLLDLIDQDPEAIEGDLMDEDDAIVAVTFTLLELKHLGAFLEAVLHVSPSLGDLCPPVVQQVIDFAREATVHADLPVAGE